MKHYIESLENEIDECLEEALNCLDPVTFSNFLDEIESMIEEYREAI